ncbi:UPF0047 protein [Zancudomyces culisetae]|uniref:UPF0047 protein n=1 Tax=Zancudomyces culisetae TaxID=1213189 RepID=A0A1R1PDN7_ZANCU|nr:UPF0047 protein [Zancudomyces culisetae]|eukprot:OMH79115.1 UPF0047 protein [Zancudomyces culisetae]
MLKIVNEEKKQILKDELKTLVRIVNVLFRNYYVCRQQTLYPPEKINWNKDADQVFLYGPVFKRQNNIINNSRLKSALKKKSPLDLLGSPTPTLYYYHVKENSIDDKPVIQMKDVDLAGSQNGSTDTLFREEKKPKITFNRQVERCMVVFRQEEELLPTDFESESEVDDSQPTPIRLTGTKQRKNRSTFVIKLAPTSLNDSSSSPSRNKSSRRSAQRLLQKPKSSGSTSQTLPAGTSTPNPNWFWNRLSIPLFDSADSTPPDHSSVTTATLWPVIRDTGELLIDDAEDRIATTVDAVRFSIFRLLDYKYTNMSGSSGWSQVSFALQPRKKGCYLVTNEIVNKINPQLKDYKIGMANIFLQHTSASLTLNENADPDVRTDMTMILDKIAPENAPYIHTYEGRDDMPGHVKSSLMGVSLSIPISNGKLGLGTWQGIWLNEHRIDTHQRRVLVTLFGEKY